MANYHIEPVQGLDHVMTAFVGKDNPIELRLMDGKQEFDASGASSIRVRIGSAIIDSTTDTEAFDRTEDNVGHINLFIGSIEGIEPKAYNLACEVVYDKDGEREGSAERTLYFGTVRIVVKKPEI